jgi:isocitrate dehydrogenase (NAD+)
LRRSFRRSTSTTVWIETACHRLVRSPGAFEGLLAPMQYGDILSDLCAGLIGGLGVAPGANVGDTAATADAIAAAAEGTADAVAAEGGESSAMRRAAA